MKVITGFNPNIPGESLEIAHEVAGTPPGERILVRERPRDKHPDIARVLELLELLEAGRARLGEQLWAQIPSVITEHASDPAGPTINTYSQVQGWVTITTVVASVAPGLTGTLTLGDTVMYLPAGVLNLIGLQLQLSQSDVRQLTVSGTGPVSLVLCGHVSPADAQLPT